MRLVKVAIASQRTNVGAVRGNVDRAVRVAREMAAEQTTLGVFQEQLVGGYPAEDLVQWHRFVEAQQQELQRFARDTATAGTVFVIGFVAAHEAHRYNCAAVVHRGEILGAVPKEELPTYNVFYEARTFSRGMPHVVGQLWGSVPFGDLLFGFDWGVLGVEICEDIWSPDGPMRRRVYSGAEIVANLSASPYRVGVLATRREMIATRSADNQCVVAYSNAVGAQDGLIFDGGGHLYQNGRPVLETQRFREGWGAAVVDLDRTLRLRAENTTWRNDALRFLADGKRVAVVAARAPGADRSGLAYPVPPGQGGSFFLPPPAPSPTTTPRDPRAEFCDELLDALALGVGDYFEKNRFRLIGVALSGGRDSLLALLIAHRYVTQRHGAAKAPELLRAFYMPTRFSSDKTRRAAEQVAADLGVPLRIVSVEEAFEREIEAVRAMLQPGEEVSPVTLQNIQARIRGARMWSWSNSTGGLFLQTGNMSEKAVGYTTVGGDLEGALSVISNVPKTVVIYLCEYLRDTLGHPGIKLVLSHPAGPELAADQEGEKELMPFPVLDACFALHAGEKLGPDEMQRALASLFPHLPAETLRSHVTRFVKMFSQSIYKWVQAPLGLHVGNLDLDRERALQLPVVSSDEWSRPKE
jgi:NAD+ synthase (glutamine-hydrolysing)